MHCPRHQLRLGPQAGADPEAEALLLKALEAVSRPG